MFLPVILLLLIACVRTVSNKNEIRRLRENWRIFPSNALNANGTEISLPEFKIEDWYKTDLPKTVLAALVENGVYEDIYYDDNLESIPKIIFESSWWYRNEFIVNDINDESYSRLVFEGINYRADIWLNGKKVSDKNDVYGGFRIFEVDVSEYLKVGKNTLAIEVFPPQPAEPTIGFVDWNPAPPDKNMGVWRDVTLKINGKISVNDSFVKTKVNKETLKEAELEVQTKLKNHTSSEISGNLVVEIEDITKNH